MNEPSTNQGTDPRVPLAQALRQAGAELALQQPPAAVLQAAHAALQAAVAARSPEVDADAQAQAVAQARAGQRAAPARLPTARPHRGSRLRWPAWTWPAAALGGLLLLACAGVLLRAPVLGPAPLPGAVPGLRAQPAGWEGGNFLAVLPRERWPADALQGASPGWLVPTELPAQRLAALGLPFDPARAGDSVRAELLVHASGEVLAVRVLP